jgi:hypothetical protein
MLVMNIYASDEYYMPVMNIIYACDDICDLCEYLRLLEKKKKIFAESKSHCSVTSRMFCCANDINYMN